VRFDVLSYGVDCLVIEQEYLPIAARPDAFPAMIGLMPQNRAGGRALETSNELADRLVHRAYEQMYVRRFDSAGAAERAIVAAHPRQVGGYI